MPTKQKPIEITAIMPVYYDDIGPVEIIDGMLHITFSTLQPNIGGAEPERIVVTRLMVRPDKVETHRAVIDEAFRLAAECVEEGRAAITH